MSTISSALARVIRLAHWVMWSRTVRWGTLASGVLSLVLVFGYASDTMYGIKHGANLIAYWHIDRKSVV